MAEVATTTAIQGVLRATDSLLRFGSWIQTTVNNTAFFETALILTTAGTVLPLMLDSELYSYGSEFAFDSLTGSFFDELTIGVS